MPNQLKTRIQAIDAVTHYRQWVDLEVNEGGVAITILNPVGVKDGDEFKVVSKVWVIRDQFIGFIVGYLISGIGAYDKTTQDLVLSIAEQNLLISAGRFVVSQKRDQILNALNW